MQNFRALGAPPPDPPIANFWLRACLLCYHSINDQCKSQAKPAFIKLRHNHQKQTMVAENGSNIYRDDGKRYQLPGLSQLVQNFKIFSGFEPKLNIFSSKNCNLSGVLNELMQLKRHKRELPLGDFCDFFKKKRFFMPFGSHFTRF